LSFFSSGLTAFQPDARPSTVSPETITAGSRLPIDMSQSGASMSEAFKWAWIGTGARKAAAAARG